MGDIEKTTLPHKEVQKFLEDPDDIDRIDALLSAKYDGKLDEENACGTTPVCYWATMGKWDFVRHALDKYGYDVNRVDSYKYSQQTLLFAAVQSGRRGNTEFVKELVEKYGAKIDVVDASGMTPLLYACYNNSASSVYDVIRYLIEKGSDINAVDKEGYNALFKSVGFAGTGVEVAKMLYQLSPQLLDAKTNKGDDILAVAANGKDMEVLQWLLSIEDASGKKKFDLNGVDAEGNTPLIKLCGFGSNDATVEVLKIFYKLGASAEVRGKEGTTALHAACGMGAGSDDVVRFLMRNMKCDPNARDDWGKTPMHAVCGFGCGYFDPLDSMIDNGGDVKVVDNAGRTPLHYLISGWNGMFGRGPKILKLLLKNGADPNAKDEEGRTPLSMAEEEGKDDAVALLKGN